ncbi:MAG: hypothetical protein IT362_03095 [Deltaproteobacteria bacterium]|nr:hypothetical protein [Deltaproteobacteria bacterium]
MDKFIKKVDLLSKKELDKVQLLAFYYQYGNVDFCFTVDDVCSWFTTVDVHLPNKARLKKNLSNSKKFIKGKELNSFRLHANEMQQLSKSYPFMTEEDEEIVCSDTILPWALYVKTRGYIEVIAKQINASFESNIFDGCADRTPFLSHC